MSLHSCLAALLRTLKQLGHLHLLIQMVSLWFLLACDHILISFDLADAHMDPPPVSGGVSRGEDAMIVDDDGK